MIKIIALALASFALFALSSCMHQRNSHNGASGHSMSGTHDSTKMKMKM